MLNGKVVVVLGGKGLIGGEIVTAIKHNHGIAVAASRSGSSLSQQPSESSLDRDPATLNVVEVDIASPPSVERMIQTVSAAYGKIDAIVNCAWPKNDNFGRRFEFVTYEDFCENVNMHLGGYFVVCQKAIEYFSKLGGGNIINFSSIYGLMAPRFELYEGTTMTKEVEYVVSKAGIIQLTKYLAKYVKGKNIRVNCISPGGVFNNQDEKFLKGYNSMCLNKGMLASSDISGTVLYLLSDMSRYVNGQNITVDDGFTV